MKYRIVVRPEVELDLLQAEAWYEQKQSGLGREFLRDVREKIASLSENPLLYRVTARPKQVRWAYPKRFPYRIVFRVIEDVVVVHAVLHAARHDRHWKKRV